MISCKTHKPWSYYLLLPLCALVDIFNFLFLVQNKLGFAMMSEILKYHLTSVLE